jgi:hypothetical protein
MKYTYLIAVFAVAVVITLGFNQSAYSLKIPSAPGAMDACLETYSYDYCRQILLDPDPGNICGPLEAAGVPCPIN